MGVYEESRRDTVLDTPEIVLGGSLIRSAAAYSFGIIS